MRALDIAIKDLIHSARSHFILVFALGLPLLTTGVFYAAFGGFTAGETDSAMPAVKVFVVNQDAPGWAGQLMVNTLRNPSLAAFMEVTESGSAAEARAAVDSQEAGLAVIIPADFTRVLSNTGETALVEIYQDPTLTTGPAIVQAIVGEILDGFSGARIAVTIAARQWTDRGLIPSADLPGSIGSEYGLWAASHAQDPNNPAWWTVRPASGQAEPETNQLAGMISTIMAMMLVFYCFFTGTAATQSILQEQEDGTLPRLFSTPTPRAIILGGKLLAVLVTLFLQVTVLAGLSALLFGIQWGSLTAVSLAVAGTTFLSASFAICLTSFLKNTKQAGIVYGVVVNLVGWLGIARLFAGIIPGMAKISGITDVVSLFSPQGWAARIWQEALAGAPVWFTFLCMLGISAVFFWIGIQRFNRRFAV